jgi:large subunit ribosomal protein L13|tara:strand:- start:3483 stop:3899 length:417 start_codon:yes stop_codon:yes gene_type:complete
MIIDATDHILGRMANQVAKQALLGNDVSVVNCEKIIITGKKTSVFAKYKNLQDKGTPVKGPFIYRTAERFVKRTIRGMLPYKQARGREAFARIKIYKGVPIGLKDKETITLPGASVNKLKKLQYTSVGAVCSYLGGKA